MQQAITVAAERLATRIMVARISKVNRPFGVFFKQK